MSVPDVVSYLGFAVGLVDTISDCLSERPATFSRKCLEHEYGPLVSSRHVVLLRSAV